MAHFVSGMRCSLCGEAMLDASQVMTFTPFVADRADPLFTFSDAVMHMACFRRHPLSALATRWHDEASLNRLPSARRCAACGEFIVDHDDYFCTGLLASSPSHPLYELNFVHLHRRHAETWQRFAEFKKKLEDAQASGTWKGPRLEFVSTQPLCVRWVVDQRESPERG